MQQPVVYRATSADGLDAVAVSELREILKQLQTKYGITIVPGKHLLIEIEKLVHTL